MYYAWQTHVICYAIGTFLSWVTLSSIHGWPYTPALTADFFIMLGIGALYYIPLIIFSPIIFTFFFMLADIVAFPFIKKREDKLKKQATEKVLSRVGNKTRDEILAMYPRIDKRLTREHAIEDLIEKEMYSMRLFGKTVRVRS